MLEILDHLPKKNYFNLTTQSGLVECTTRSSPMDFSIYNQLDFILYLRQEVSDKVFLT